MSQPSLLLIGPTGSGKTPLGNYLEQHGLKGRRVAHFDFGENLRTVSRLKNPEDPLTADDIAFVRQILGSGALLENDKFYIAEHIFHSFINRTGICPEDRVLLNGLPRHAGQAEDVARFADVRLVMELRCTPETVLERIRTNRGGDRTRRTDDSVDEVKNKLEIFRSRTEPLTGYYRDRGVPVVTIEVNADTGPEDIVAQIKEKQ